MIDLKNNNVIYVSRDLERALAFDLDNPNYYIISNNSDFAKSLTQKNILLINSERQLDTWELLEHEETKNFIKNISNPQILVFKNTRQIERICETNSWKLLNPSAQLATFIEEKISQTKFLKDLTSLLPKFEIKLCRDIKWQNKKFILQFNRAHTGSGTFFIKNKKQLEEITKNFPNREAKISEYIKGPVLTSNNPLAADKTLVGNISYQITGVKKFTDNKFSTIGNDWFLGKQILSEKQKKEYEDIVFQVGEKMRASGWQGLFGVDVIMDEKTGKLYLLEINARQPASTTYESTLQRYFQKDRNQITVFEAHLLALLENKIDSELITITDGAQILRRILKNKKNKLVEKQLQKIKDKFNLNVILYQNEKENSELARFQTKTHFLKKHNKINRLAKKIKKISAI
ncbi:MAG: ATP-grasp domain-containing protein [Patescibacteria group bacterium]